MPSAFALPALIAVVVVLTLVGVVPTWPGLVHAVGLPPLDLSFDLRLLVARAPSWPVFAVALVAAIAVRAAVLVAVVRAATGVELRLRGVVGFYAIAAIPLGIGAALEFAALASVYAWYAYAGLAVTLIAVTAFSVWFLSRRLGMRRPWAVAGAYVAAVGVLGAIARLVGPWSVVLVPLSAGITYAALRAQPRDVRRRPAARIAVVTVAIVTTLASSKPAAPLEDGAVLFLVPGVDTSSGRGSMYRFDPAAHGFDCERVFYYSYRGLSHDDLGRGEAACPIRLHRPYDRVDTQRPLDELVGAFSSQLEAIRGATADAPIVVLTHSQGAWLAWDALARGESADVTRLVMLAPSTRTPVGYPPAGVSGAGAVGADALRALTTAARGLGIGSFDPDAVLAREMLARPQALEALFARPLPRDVGATIVAAALDVPIAPEGWEVSGADLVVVDATHAGLPTSGAAAEAIRVAVTGASHPTASVTAALLRGALDAFMPPPA